jgi:ribonuclease VapC
VAQIAVLDASALIALLEDEPGADSVAPIIGGSLLSTVNLAEVLEREAATGLATGGEDVDFEELGIQIAPFTARQAEIAARMRQVTRVAGLSLADRACLALALDLGAVAVTADRSWGNVDVGVEVQVIR